MKKTTVDFWHSIYRQMLAEFIGTFVMVVFCVGCNAQTTLSNKTYGSSISNALGSGVGVMLALNICLTASGGHINPAVSVALASVGKFSWLRVPFYMLAQYCGAFLGAAVVYPIYQGALYSFNGNVHDRTTAGVWTTFPQDFISLPNAVLDTITSTAILMTLNLAVGDTKNMSDSPKYAPFFLGLIVATLSFGYSWNTGNPMNPARDLAPRFFMDWAGWGSLVYSGPNYMWWWVPVVGPHAGAIIGAYVYVLFVEIHHPEDAEEEKSMVLDDEKRISQMSTSRFSISSIIPESATKTKVEQHELECLLPASGTSCPSQSNIRSHLTPRVRLQSF